ncbi:hypothetical protein DFH06DRAFT_1127022 [Mycena polygramma]|nr:hypothetical protein DFH06DRAFT_1127022 [Mycena polygramma]
MYAKKIAHRPRIDRGCGDFQSEGSRYWDQSFVQFAVCIYIQKELRKGGGCIRRQTMRTLREQVPAATGARVGRGGVTRERNEKARGAFSRGKGFSQQYRKQMSTLRRTLQMVQKLTAHSAMCVLHALWLSGRGQCTDVEASTDERTTAARYDCGGIERCQTRICGPCGGDPATRRQQEVEFNETSMTCTGTPKRAQVLGFVHFYGCTLHGAQCTFYRPHGTLLSALEASLGFDRAQMGSIDAIKVEVLS